MTTEAYQGNPRLRSVRIDVDGKSCQFMTDSQRVTMIPLKIRRKQNRKLLTPPSGTMSNVMSGGVDIPMIKTTGSACSRMVNMRRQGIWRVLSIWSLGGWLRSFA